MGTRATRSRPTGSPLTQLARLLSRARRLRLHEPEAMTLATAARNGRPSARMVLLRGLDSRGLTFFTNYQSRKARELASRPHAAVVLYWPELRRQVRVEGRVSRLTARESDDYFASRPRGAQLAAWASRQSAPLRSRRELMAGYRGATVRFAGVDVPRPASWGGFRIVPEAFEFWTSGTHRLHDRIRYTRQGGRWRGQRLAP